MGAGSTTDPLDQINCLRPPACVVEVAGELVVLSAIPTALPNLALILSSVWGISKRSASLKSLPPLDSHRNIPFRLPGEMTWQELVRSARRARFAAGIPSIVASPSCGHRGQTQQDKPVSPARSCWPQYMQAPHPFGQTHARISWLR
jgi:hypothetical protein